MAFKMSGWSAFTKPKDNGLNERQENKLNKLINKRKTVHKDSREYVTIQNKINRLKEKEGNLEKGTYIRHSKKGKKRTKKIPAEQDFLKKINRNRKADEEITQTLPGEPGMGDWEYDPDDDEPTGPKG